jgi:hypothetical protein
MTRCYPVGTGPHQSTQLPISRPDVLYFPPGGRLAVGSGPTYGPIRGTGDAGRVVIGACLAERTPPSACWRRRS